MLKQKHLDRKLIAGLVHQVAGTIVENNTAYGGQPAGGWWNTAYFQQQQPDYRERGLYWLRDPGESMPCWKLIGCADLGDTPCGIYVQSSKKLYGLPDQG